VTAWRWMALWAAFLAAWTALMLAFSDLDAISPLLLGGAALGALALALLVGRGVERPDAVRAVPDASMATVGVAFGLALLLGGAEVGVWLLAIGALVLALGIGGLVRERRAQRRSA
jgi:hypothetical protein